MSAIKSLRDVNGKQPRFDQSRSEEQAKSFFLSLLTGVNCTLYLDHFVCEPSDLGKEIRSYDGVKFEIVEGGRGTVTDTAGKCSRKGYKSTYTKHIVLFATSSYFPDISYYGDLGCTLNKYHVVFILRLTDTHFGRLLPVLATAKISTYEAFHSYFRSQALALVKEEVMESKKRERGRKDADSSHRSDGDHNDGNDGQERQRSRHRERERSQENNQHRERERSQENDQHRERERSQENNQHRERERERSHHSRHHDQRENHRGHRLAVGAGSDNRSRALQQTSSGGDRSHWTGSYSQDRNRSRRLPHR